MTAPHRPVATILACIAASTLLAPACEAVLYRNVTSKDCWPAAGTALSAPYDYETQDRTIVLNSIGIGNWRYLNPRRPVPVVERFKEQAGERDKDDESTGYSYLRQDRFDALWNACAEMASITFENASPANAFVVTIPYKYKQPKVADVRKSVADLIAELEKNLPAAGTCPQCVGQGLLSQVNALIPRMKAAVGTTIATDPLFLTLLFDINETEGTIPPKPDSRPGERRIQRSLADTAEAFQDLRYALEPVDRPANVDCEKKRTECSFSFTLLQNDRKMIGGKDWARLIRQSGGLLSFSVSFFDESSSPSNTTGYLQVKSRFDEPASKRSISVVAGATYRQDPQLDADPTDTIPGFSAPDAPYGGDTLKRFPAAARIELTQTLGTRASSKIVGAFKDDDFGGDQTGDLKVSQWEANVFSVSGASLRFGKFGFAAPASGIAINERGEGYQINWRWLSGGQILKRESLTGKANDADQDSEAWLLQVRGLAVNQVPLLRDLDLFHLTGTERKDLQRPYDYSTYGASLDWALNESVGGRTDFWISGSLAYFTSEREPDSGFVPPEDDGDPTTPGFVEVNEANGDVVLFEASINQTKSPNAPGQQAERLRGIGLRYAVGSGDKAESPLEDEGYLGETAGFSPDQLFLRRFAGSLRDRAPEPTDPAMTQPPPILVGKGLSNKRYLGISYVEQEKPSTRTGGKRFDLTLLSPLRLVAWVLGAGPEEIELQTTTLRGHWYRFREPVLGQTDAGYELGVEWLLEAPKGVKSTLTLGKYFPGNATRPFFIEYPTLVEFSVAITLK